MIHSQPVVANLVGQSDAWEQILETLTERPLSGYQCLYPLLLMLTPPSSGYGLLPG
jgi:hypothetical protein